ncbi:hypothetical protein AB0393_34680 [Streptomyces cyaneofuscatus]|uniref:hypothetical protein n=1 Tax=Streptomyces cyaneofuscatus TaxID=66883 RepID=UPI00344E8A16
MASTKTTYSTTHPTTGKTVTFTKGGRPIRWITWADLGDGFVHFGFSSQEDYKKAVRAPRSTNPYATRYEATAATVVDAEQPAEPQQPTTPATEEASPALTAEESPAPVVTSAEVADVLDHVADAHAAIVPRGGAAYLSAELIALTAYGLPCETDEDAYGAHRSELRRTGRLPHMTALVKKLHHTLRAHLGDRYNFGDGVTPDQVRAVAQTVRLAAQYPVASIAVHVTEEGGEAQRDVVVVMSEPDRDGTVQVHSARHNAPLRVPLAGLQPAPELPPEPEGEITDWWTITDADGVELTRVEAADDPGARKAALRNRHVIAASHRDNGFAVRPLRTSELATPVGELRGLPRVSPAAAAARTITATTGFTPLSVMAARAQEDKEREAALYAKYRNEADGVELAQVEADEELTPGEAATRFLGD